MATKSKPTKKKKTTAKASAKPVAVRKSVKTAKKSSVKATKSVPKTAKAAIDNKRAKFQPLLLIFAAILFIAAALILMRYEADSPPAGNSAGDAQEARAFADGIVEHLRKAECAQIADKTSAGFQAVISRDDWLEQCAVASSVLTGAAQPVEQVDSNPEDEITEISYRILATDEQAYVITTQLVYQDNTWQLQGINSQVES